MQAGDGSATFNNITFVDSADVRLHSSAASAGDLFINAGTDLDVDGSLNITATTGNISQGSELDVGTTSTFTTSASNGTITLNDADNTFTGAVALNTNGSSGNATIKNDRALLLAASSVGGAFSATATAGNITQNGALDIEGVTTLVTSGQGAEIVLTTDTNAFTSQLLITTNETGSDIDADVSIDGGTTNLIVGTSTIDGNLTLRSGGTLTDTDGSTVTVKGTLSANTDASASAITLNDLAVDGAFTLAPDGTGAVTIVNDAGLILAASTMGGTFSGTATTGNITQTGALNIEGATTLVTSGETATIDLLTNGSGNAFTSQLLITTTDTNSLYTADVSIDGGTTNLIIGNSTIAGNLTLLSGGTLTDTAGSTVTVKATLTAKTDASASAITLNDLAVDGAFTLDPNGTGAVTIVNDAGLILAASTMGGSFSGTATTGDISDSGNLAITGASTFITTANNRSIILDQSGNAFTSTVTMQAGNGSNATFDNITFVDSADVRLHSSAASAGDLFINASTDLAVGGNLSITATTGDITQGGALDIEGVTTLVTSGQGADIVLTTDTNAFTSQLLITTNETGSDIDADVSIDGGTTNLIVGTSTIDGNLTLRSGGTLTDTDGSTVTVKGTLSANTDASASAITLNDLAVTGAFTLAPNSTGAVTIVNATDLELAASTMGGTFSGTATTGNITQNGALDIEGETTLVTSGQGADIVLTTDTNAFTSQLLITTNETGSDIDADVSIDGGTTNLIVGTSTIDGNLTLLSGGTITDTNSSTVTVKGTLSATTDASASAITLNDLAVTGAFTLAPNSTGAVTIVNAANLILAASTMGGTFSGTATTGDITQSGALTITGTSTLVTSANHGTITLTNTGNALTGKLLITTNDDSPGTVGTVNIDGGTTNLIIGLSTIDGNLTLRSGGTITDDGIATVRGTLTATTDLNNKIITLDQLAVTGAFTLAPDGTGAVTIVNDVPA